MIEVLAACMPGVLLIVYLYAGYRDAAEHSDLLDKCYGSSHEKS